MGGGIACSLPGGTRATTAPVTLSLAAVVSCCSTDGDLQLLFQRGAGRDRQAVLPDELHDFGFGSGLRRLLRAWPCRPKQIDQHADRDENRQEKLSGRQQPRPQDRRGRVGDRFFGGDVSVAVAVGFVHGKQ